MERVRTFFKELFRKVFFLNSDERRRMWPFFTLYILLFGSLTIAEGLSIALFVKRVGAQELPMWYGAIAVANLVLVGGYSAIAERVASPRMFRWIIGACGAVFVGIWALLEGGNSSPAVLGSLFAAREIAYTLFLMHFGTYLQDYFNRKELTRVMPIVYAGGRVGGMIGGAALSNLSGTLGLQNFLLICGAFALLAALSTYGISWFVPMDSGELDEKGASGLKGVAGVSAEEMDRRAQTSWRGFLQFLLKSPLAFWNTILSVVYMFCRWFLNYQYNMFFEGHFKDEVAMAQFMGFYTQIALGISLVMQLGVVGRLVARFGLHTAQISYAVMMVVAMIGTVAGLGLPAAIWARFVETELRFGLRNPINQLIVNKFSKAVRIRMRAWSIGVLIPVGTLGSAVALTGLAAVAPPIAIGAIGLVFGIGYLGVSVRMTSTFAERRRSAASMRRLAQSIPLREREPSVRQATAPDAETEDAQQGRPPRRTLNTNALRLRRKKHTSTPH